MTDSTASPGAEPRLGKTIRVANQVLFVLLILLCSVMLFQVYRSQTGGEADVGAIRAVLSDQAAAWNRGDLDGFMAGYWRDPGLTFTSADTVNKGWDATRDRYLKKYFTPNAEGKLSERGDLAFEELEVESLRSDLAIVRGRYILKLSAETAKGRFTLVFRKFVDGWKITSDHTSAAEKPEKK